MSSNAIGTIIRITFITIGLIGFWFFNVTLSYFVLCYLFNLEFIFSTLLILFTMVILVRMFYPKNVFL